MNILLVTKRFGGTSCFCVSKGRLLGAAMLILMGLPLASAWLGYTLGKGNESPFDPLISGIMLNELEEQRLSVEEARVAAEENLNALTLRLGRMQAHVMRLDALGERITRIAGLDDGEFNFSAPPAQGGPEEVGKVVGASPLTPDFINQFDELAQQLADRERQLTVLENMIRNRNLQAEIMPSGRPVHKGWISSRYGMRNDPFSGKRAYHNGLDIAAPEGTDVFGVAAGVVTWASRRGGYGKLVEINHGNGYTTRYAHLKSILVEVGDTIPKGQLIGKLGTTGRSSGPHVHFEVRIDGKTVDPMTYVRAGS